ncbi:hypothetical protein D9M68_834100 [compost metagenome]
MLGAATLHAAGCWQAGLAEIAGDDVLHVLEQGVRFLLAAVLPIAFAQAVVAECDVHIGADAM